MAGTYEIWLTNDQGLRLAQLTTSLGFSASRVVNGIGFFSLSLPASFDTNLIKADQMIQIWRAPEGGSLSLWRVYFLRRWIFETTARGEQLTISGPDTNDLLRRRIVAAFADSAEASKTDFADDMMKEVVTEAIADGTAPTPDAGTRVWSNLSIQADLGDGATITKSFAWDRLLFPSGRGLLPDLSQASKVAGTEVFFDIVPNVVSGSSITFQFQTFTGQPGRDVSDRVVFDRDRNNISNPRLEYNYTSEENYVYSGGQGEEADRNIQQVSDADRYNISIWNRCEGFADARNQSADNGVREAGRKTLTEGEPIIRFSARPLDTVGTRFGRDWDFGYKVRSRYRNIEFDAIIWVVTVSVDENDKETIQSRLEFES